MAKTGRPIRPIEKPFNPPTGPRALLKKSTHLPPQTTSPQTIRQPIITPQTTSPQTTSPQTIRQPIITPGTDSTSSSRETSSARKHRINSDLITLFKIPCPANSHPTAKGIGLYTHVGAPEKKPQFPHERYIKSDPVFLPLGGPRRIVRAGEAPEAQISILVRELCKEMKCVVEEEEKATREIRLNAWELRKRYGALEAPDRTKRADRGEGKELPMLMEGLQTSENDQDVDMQIDSGAKESVITPMRLGSSSRRPSWGYVRRRESDGAVGSTMTSAEGMERRGSAAKSGNMYEVERDPRKRGR